MAFTTPFLEEWPFFAMSHLMIRLRQLQHLALLPLNYVFHLSV